MADTDGEDIKEPPEEMELPLTIILLPHPKGDTSKVILSVGSLLERDGHFTGILPHTPSEQSTLQYIAVFGYVLNDETFSVVRLGGSQPDLFRLHRFLIYMCTGLLGPSRWTLSPPARVL